MRVICETELLKEEVDILKKTCVTCRILLIIMSLIIGSMYVVPVCAETEETVSEIDVTSEKSEDNSENLYDSVDEIAGGIVVSGKEAFSNAAAFFRNNKYLCNLILSLGESFRKIKKCSSIVLLFSIMAAVFVAVCARKNKKLRRYGLVLFLIVIPLLIFVFVYGLGTLYSFVISDNGIDAGAVENEVYQSALVLCKDIRFLLLYAFLAPEELINLLENCVIAHMNCVIGGQPHAGKTELLKYLSTFIPATESVGVYEDNREIHYKEINPGKRAVEGIISDKKGAGYSEAIRAGLRHNIDWILLSESRGVEVFDLMNALSTGSNCMTTVHLDDLRLLPDRFHEMLSGVTVSENFKNSVYKYINVAVLVVCDKHQRRKIKQVAFFTRKDGVNRCHMIYEDGEFTTEKFPADIIKAFEQYGIVDPLS